MNRKAAASFLLLLILLDCSGLFAEPTNIAEDDASHSSYSGGWENGKSDGSGFGNWILTTEGNDASRHAGFFIASKSNNPDLNGIAREEKAFGTFANGSGFEQAVAYRSFDKPLATGDSFSFMLEAGQFEKKSEQDDPTPGSVGLTLRAGSATSSVSDYNKDAVFEIGFYRGKNTYQIYDGSEKPDSGVAFNDEGMSVTVTMTGADTYDLEIQTMKDKNVSKLPVASFRRAPPFRVLQSSIATAKRTTPSSINSRSAARLSNRTDHLRFRQSATVSHGQTPPFPSGRFGT